MTITVVYIHPLGIDKLEPHWQIFSRNGDLGISEPTLAIARMNISKNCLGHSQKTVHMEYNHDHMNQNDANKTEPSPAMVMSLR